MTNQIFCYWLQGYFEISETVTLGKQQVALICKQLNRVNEPLGDYTQWLKELLLYLEKQNYKQSLLNYFLSDIRDQLNRVFLHVIDNSYDTEIGHVELKKIHDGLTHDK